MTGRTLPRRYFEALYAADADPWRFATSNYEKRKYARSMAALARARYGAGLEIGCSIGVMTRHLAQRCETLLAVDIAEAPLMAARRRCAGMPSVRFDRMKVPGDWPSGPFDLIVLSEVVYYLDEEDVAFLARCLEETLARGRRRPHGALDRSDRLSAIGRSCGRAPHREDRKLCPGAHPGENAELPAGSPQANLMRV